MSIHRLKKSLKAASVFVLVWSIALQNLVAPAAAYGDFRGRKISAPHPMQAGSSIVLYGPMIFGYQAGPARTQTQQVALGAPLAGVVRVQNGTLDGSNRAAGVSIQLNGALLSTARTINTGTATLDIPVTFAASNTLSVRITGQPGSFVIVTFIARPVITVLSPSSGVAGSTIAINGDYFDDSGPAQNIVRFTRAGGGQTLATVNTASKMQLSVVVPSDAATGPVSVQTAGGMAVSPVNFELLASAPAIADFNPKRAQIGATVVLTGTDLKFGAVNPSVTFTGANNARIAALVTAASANSVSVTVPNAAVNGVLELTTTAGKATTPTPFFVEATQDFQITVSPSAGTAIQGSAANYIITLTSEQNDFTQLATLSLEGAPAGSTVKFIPEQITAGATSTLTLRTAAGLPTGNYPFTIRATATIDGNPVARTSQASIDVLSAGTTTLSGRVLSNKEEAIPGATVSLDGKSATTDSAGNFILSGINAGTDRPVVVDGRTANVPNRTYPLITEPVTINAGEANVVPYKFYLPAIDTASEVTVVPNQTTTVTTPAVAGLTMTIPANAALVNRDGTAVARASLTTVEIDRTPAPLPPNVGTNIVYTSQPGGARSANGTKIPVVYPNLSGANPGTRVELWNFSTDLAQWYIYGYGRVSADGRVIEPEPGVGLPDFSWHLPNLPTGCDAGGCCRCCDGKGCDCPVSGSPVDLSSGIKIEKSTDVAFGGARGGLELTRIHTTNFAGSCDNCPFGRGWTHNYAIRLVGSFTQGGVGRIFMPEESIGRLFSYLRQDQDGALVFGTTATPHQIGDVIRKLTDGTFEYRYKAGGKMNFDSTGRLTAIVDRNGNATTLTYSGNNLAQVTDAMGRSLIFQYTGSRIVSMTDPLNRTWKYSYDGGNLLVTVTDPLNQSLNYEYETFARLFKVIDKRGVAIKEISYDVNGRVYSQRFADGGIETYAYELSGNMVTGVAITDPLGRVRTMRFNGAGQIVGRTDELGQSSEIKRDLTTNLVLERTGPCGCPEESIAYNGNGNPTSIADRLGRARTYEYEPVFNKVTRMTDRLGRVTVQAYDNRGNLVSVTNPLNQTTTYAYDQFGQLTEITDALNHKKRFEYDSYGNLAATIDALNNRTTMEYDAVGRLLAAVDPLGRRNEATYDPLDRIVAVKEPSGAVSQFSYDGNDNLTGTINALGEQWVNNYDRKNRLVASIDPLNNVKRYEYNLGDELVRTISPSGRKMGYGYDARGRRSSITDSLGGIVTLSYDNRGNLRTLTDQRNKTMTFSYDEMFQLIEQTDPLGGSTGFGYDAEGNLIVSVDRLGRIASFAYDGLNRRTSAVYVDAVVNYTYDAAGRLTHVDDTQGGTIDLAYDASDRLVSELTPLGTVGYTYNAAGQRVGMTAADAQPVSYAYDPAGRLAAISLGPETFTWSYDAISRPQSLSRPNGVVSSFSYDAAGRLIRMTHLNPFAVPVEDLIYRRDADGDLVAIDSVAFGTLMSAPGIAAPADGANRISQFGQEAFSFDLEGRVISRTNASGTSVYNWDARDRLTSVSMPGGQTVAYGYDAFDRRISRTTGGVTTGFLYDGKNVVRDLIAGGGFVDYLNAPGIDRKLRQSGSSGKLYFLQDHLGGTAALTDGLGSVVERSQYEAFGSRQGGASTRYGFTGRELDDLTGLVYFRARWLDPASGRFLSEDPIGTLGGLNYYLPMLVRVLGDGADVANDLLELLKTGNYTYAGNNPLNNIDPLGLFPDQCSRDEWERKAKEELIENKENTWELIEEQRNGKAESRNSDPQPLPNTPAQQSKSIPKF